MNLHKALMNPHFTCKSHLTRIDCIACWTFSSQTLISCMMVVASSFLTGTGAPALARDECKDFLSTTVPFGVTTIALSYEWLSLADKARNTMIEKDWSMELATKHTALKILHDDICFGTQEGRISMAKTGPYHQVNISECIAQRLIRLLTYLHFQNPEKGWDKYLTTITEEEAISTPSDSIILQGEKSFIATVNWSKIILSGHSQGAGHAAYIAKNRIVGRVVLFSGPQEGLCDGFFKADEQHWLHEKIATPKHCWFAMKHAKEEGTSRCIRDNWAVMPAFKESYMNGQDIVKVDSPSYGEQLSSIRAARRRNQHKPRLFETFLPYEGYEEGVTKPGRPYHASTIIDGSTPLVTKKRKDLQEVEKVQQGQQEQHIEGQKDEQEKDQQQKDQKEKDQQEQRESDRKESVYKKVLWPFLLLGDRGIINLDPAEIEGFWQVRTEADLLPGGLLPRDMRIKPQRNRTTPIGEGEGENLYIV